MIASSSSSKTAIPRHQSTKGSGWNAQGEPNDDPETIFLGVYLPWATEQREKEHVSFASFVEKFKLSNLQDAQDAYEALINSTHLKTLRRQLLNTAYNSFRKHSLRRFWSNNMLKMERCETKTNFYITTAKTSRIVQDASLKETSRAARLLEDDIDPC